MVVKSIIAVSDRALPGPAGELSFTALPRPPSRIRGWARHGERKKRKEKGKRCEVRRGGRRKREKRKEEEEKKRKEEGRVGKAPPDNFR